MQRSRRLDIARETPHPAYVVWELTLACDQPCTHCGSRAGDARARELTTAEALGVVKQLAYLGAREVALIGGEAYLHAGFLDIIRALRAADVRPTMTTGGRAIDAPLARAMADAGMVTVSVSLDGTERTHDTMRASPGSFLAATASMDHLRAVGINVASNINLNRWNVPDLESVYEVLLSHGARAWQVQLTVPLGRAADRPEMLLQPWELLDVLPRVAALKRRAFDDGITITLGNNLGYFGPDEALLRSLKPDGDDHWQGCLAGQFVMGIESDGAVKGCPSLQTSHYVGGNLLDTPVATIWNDSPELGFTRKRTVEDLWGFCRTCAFAEPCMGGCSFTAHALFGRPGNNPYCQFRARTLQKRGERERLVRRQPAPGDPFDNGLYEIVVEPFDAPDPRPDVSARLLRVIR